ncbi:hypothetical protein G9A89_000738 [Geosiphon pyriformis]|nr:hypothetical protein G9A89_000738 [Geosiphon pyriformis]
MTSPQQNQQDQELQPYGAQDIFDDFIDLDFLRNNTSSMDEDIDIGEMSNSDLFRYFLEGELAKGPGLNNIDQQVLNQQQQQPDSFPTPMQDITQDFSQDFALLSSPVLSNNDIELNHLSPSPLSPISPPTDTQELHSQAIVNPVTVGPSLAVLNAQLAELLAKLPLIKQEVATDSKLGVTNLTTSSVLPQTQINSHPSVNVVSSNSAASSIVSPDSPPVTNLDTRSEVELKKLTSKERRQLRNKISARNFRVRRKEYIGNLETTNQEQQEEINLLRQALAHLQEENTKLQEEVKELRKRQRKNSKSVIASPPSPPHVSSISKEGNNGVTLAANVKNNSNHSNTRVNSIKSPGTPSSSSSSSSSSTSSSANRLLVIPNVNKDTPSSPSRAQKSWQDGRVRVQTTFIPEFSLDKHLLQDKSQHMDEYNWANQSFVFGEDGQKAWVAYLLVSTLMRHLTALFCHAVSSLSPTEMVPGLYLSASLLEKPYTKPIQTQDLPETFTSQTSVNEVESLENCKAVSSFNIEPPVALSEEDESSCYSFLLDNSSTLVGNAKEASVLDWLYDTMVRYVVEQSQAEAKLHELQSDWVGDEFEDNVLPLLF